MSRGYAVAAFQWAVAEGVIGGYAKNGVRAVYLGPSGDAERAQFAAMLFHMDDACGILQRLAPMSKSSLPRSMAKRGRLSYLWTRSYYGSFT